MADSSFAWKWGSYNQVHSTTLFVPTTDLTTGTSNGRYCLLLGALVFKLG